MSNPSERPPIASAPISVVLTAHDVGADLLEVVMAWMSFLDGLQRDYEVILVDDGSRDGTGPQADHLTQQFSRWRVLHHADRQGEGVALRDGIAEARFPLVFYTACDKQFQPAELARLLENIDKVDLVTGYRVGQPVPGWMVWGDRLFRLLFRVLFGMPREPRDCWLGWRGFGRRWLARWLFGIRVRDPECAFRLFRREIFARLPIQSTGQTVHIEILAKANFLGCWMAEVPVTCLLPRGKEAGAGEPSRRLRQELTRLLRRPEFGAWPSPPPSTPKES